MILDTTAVVDLLRGNKPELLDRLKNIAAHSIHATSVTVFEICQGCKDKKIEEFFDNIHILNLDRESASKAGEIQRKLKQQGQIIDPEDCMIAGIAINNNLPVLTANKKHFSRIGMLKAEFY